MNRLLVTGASGFVGRSTIAALRDTSFDVHAVCRRPPRLEDMSATWHSVDLLDTPAMARLLETLRPTHLLHLAWYAEHGKFWDSPDNLTWLAASTSLLQHFQHRGGQRAVFVGTCAEYDWSYGWLSETVTPLNPTSLYGACKDALRRAGEASCKVNGLSWCWARLFFLYGAHESPNRLVASVMRSLLNGVEAPCSSGEQVRDFMHVDDAGRALARLLSSRVDGPINVATGEPTRVRDLVAAIAAITGQPHLLRMGSYPTRPDEPPFIVGDNRRLSQALGFRATPQRQALEEMASAIRSMLEAKQ